MKRRMRSPAYAFAEVDGRFFFSQTHTHTHTHKRARAHASLSLSFAVGHSVLMCEAKGRRGSCADSRSTQTRNQSLPMFNCPRPLRLWVEIRLRTQNAVDGKHETPMVFPGRPISGSARRRTLPKASVCPCSSISQWKCAPPPSRKMMTPRAETTGCRPRGFSGANRRLKQK